MAYKKVDQLDKDGNVVQTFESVNDCVRYTGITINTLHKKCDSKHLHNGFYYHIHENTSGITKAVCEWCGKEFDCQRFRIEDGRKHLFCSKKCNGFYMKSQTQNNCTCPICGKKFHRKPYQILRNHNNYCSVICANKAKEILYLGTGNHRYGVKGSNNPSWRSDQKISMYGYKLIRKADHPFANSDDFVFEHRLVAEEFLLDDNNSVTINGVKYLSPQYIVHHLDFDKLNNDPANLIVMELGNHTSMHMKLYKNRKNLLSYCENYNLDYEKVLERVGMRETQTAEEDKINI